MTKEMYEKCLNREMVVLGKLSEDVQKAMKGSTHGFQILDSDLKWLECDGPSWFGNLVYRINPSTPYDPEFEETNVILGKDGFYCVSFGVRLSAYIFHYKFLGIIYEKEGVETLRTSIDLSFGTPKRVRFAK